MTEREAIQLSASDHQHERAEKIWRLLGFANDRLGHVPMLAGYLAAYKELDDKARVHGETPTIEPVSNSYKLPTAT